MNDSTQGIPQAHSWNGGPGNSSGLDPKDLQVPIHDHGGTDLTALRDSQPVELELLDNADHGSDLGENPDQVVFPDTRTCRDLVNLKKDVETLQKKCEECHSKPTGGDSEDLLTGNQNRCLKEGSDSNCESIGPILELSEEGTCTVGRIAHQGQSHER